MYPTDAQIDEMLTMPFNTPQLYMKPTDQDVLRVALRLAFAITWPYAQAQAIKQVLDDILTPQERAERRELKEFPYK